MTKKFWISKISNRLKFNTAKWAKELHSNCNKILWQVNTWVQSKQAFIDHFAALGTNNMIARQAKKLVQTSTIKEYVHAYKDLSLRAPPGMIFGNFSMRLNFYNGLNPKSWTR